MTTGLFVGPTLLLAAYFLHRAIAHEKQSRRVLQDVTEQGLAQPASLHPIINEEACIGCGACVEACPENNVLGLVDGKAVLVDPSHCIGHGACRAECPTNAITLVFGTAERGVDIPHVTPSFETNVPGIFIAGELGGMGLIRNAIEQGRQAIDSIRKIDGVGGETGLDVVIVGAGPAGFAATLAAKQHGLRSVTLEQDSLGGTIAHYPRGKLVMTMPAHLPLVGKMKFTETTKERLLEYLRGAEVKTGLEINYGERLQDVARVNGGFAVKTSRSEYATRSILLAVGRRGSPRKLGVPGEDLPKVTYRLDDPGEHRNRHVLVVGGGDSALEAAIAIAAEAGTTVSLSYRADAFSRAKPKNRERVEEARSAGRLHVLLKSNVQRIDADHVVVEQDGRSIQLRNDAVIVCAGGVLPTPFLKKLGIEIQTKFGTA